MEPVYSRLCPHPARTFTELYREKTVAVGGNDDSVKQDRRARYPHFTVERIRGAGPVGVASGSLTWSTCLLGAIVASEQRGHHLESR